MFKISTSLVGLRRTASVRLLSSYSKDIHGAQSKVDNHNTTLSTAVAIPPAKRLAIVTCMDPRINPFKQLGLKEGDAHIIRNAGGMARDAIRSLIISQRLLGTNEIEVYHHDGCGMLTFDSSTLRKMVKDSDPRNEVLSQQVDTINFMEFQDLEQSIRDDVQFLKDCPLILKDTKVTGWIHHIGTGKATRVV